MKKVLLLLQGGTALLLAGTTAKQFGVLRMVGHEWRKINQRALREAIRNLYRSKMIDFREHGDGTVSVHLAEEGKRRVLRYNLDSMKIKKPAQWDQMWRVVVFDIPEEKLQGRKAFAGMLKRLGFHPLQKSVFIYPYECKNEVDFVVEIFELRPYVRFLLVKSTDVDIDLKNRFDLTH